MNPSPEPQKPVLVANARHSILNPVLLLASVFIVLLVLKMGSAVVGPILFFVFLSILIIPIYNGLKKRISSGLALVVMLLGVAGASIGLFWLVAGSFSKLVAELPAYDLHFQSQTEALAQTLQTLQMPPEVIDQVREALFGVVTKMTVGFLSTTVNMITVGIMTLIALAFIMLESEAFSQRLHRGLGDSSDLLRRMEVFQRSLFGYVMARVKLNFITGVGVFIMLVIFRVDYALLWSILAFILSFIPYIGLLVAMIPPILLGTAESGVWTGVILALGYFVINQVVEQVLEPRIVGTEMTLSPTLTLFSVIFWTWVLGSLGAMLAGPLAALTILLLASFDDTRWIAILFSSDDSPLVTGEMEEKQQATHKS